MKPIKPKTNPNFKMTKKIDKATANFFSLFSSSFLSQKTGIKIGVISCHKFRNKVSPQAADTYCKISEVREAGFTREMLRPDILHWYGDE